MIRFALALLLALVAVGLLIAAAKTRHNHHGAVPFWAPVPAALAAVGLFAWSCTAVVTASVGVPVTFGKVGEPLMPGLHGKAPWTNVETYPIRNSDTLTLGDTTVKTSEQGQLTVAPALSYRIDPRKASDIYLIARDSDRLADSIVIPYARAGVQAAFSKLTNEEATATRIADLPDLVRAEVEAELEEQGVEVVTLTMSAPVPSEQLQATIDGRIAAVEAQKRSAIENETRLAAADAVALANQKIAASTTQGTLCQQFIDALREGQVTGTILADPCSTGPKPEVILNGATQ